MNQPMKVAYRVFRISNNARPATLFHAWKKTGRRELSLDEVLIAHKGKVANPGGGHRRIFTSGWHVVLSKEDMVKYLKRFKRKDLVQCKVLVDGIRDKPGSKIKLADKMLIRRKDWLEACREWYRREICEDCESK